MNESNSKIYKSLTKKPVTYDLTSKEGNNYFVRKNRNSIINIYNTPKV